MKRIALLALVTLVSTGGSAQHAGCPPRDAPAPTAPPGPPPPVDPVVTFGKTPSDPVGVEFRMRPGATPLADEVVVEDGHLLWLPNAVALRAPETRAPKTGTSLPSGVLAGWKFERALADADSVERIYSRADGSWLGIEERDFQADGSVMSLAPDNALVGGRPARISRSKGRTSGCVATYLSWLGARRSTKLTVVGPLAIAEQRALLEQVGGALVAAGR